MSKPEQRTKQTKPKKAKNRNANKLNTKQKKLKKEKKNQTKTKTKVYELLQITPGFKQYDIRSCLQFIFDAATMRASSKIPAGLSTPNTSILRALRVEKCVGWNLINLALVISLRLCFTMSFLPELPLKTQNPKQLQHHHFLLLNLLHCKPLVFYVMDSLSFLVNSKETFKGNTL